jgi:hypothetical protein
MTHQVEDVSETRDGFSDEQEQEDTEGAKQAAFPVEI